MIPYITQVSIISFGNFLDLPEQTHHMHFLKIWLISITVNLDYVTYNHSLKIYVHFILTV